MKTFRFAGPLDDESPAVSALWDRGCLGVAEQGSDVLAYFDRERDLSDVPALAGSWEDASEVDHVAAYFAGLEPVGAGDLVIAPTHTRPTLEAYQQVVWLDPGSAFGTGHHETTRLALRALAAMDVRKKHVLDVGSGSGILAIAADRLGAASAVGVDTDLATLEVARGNAQRNRSRARFLHGSVDHPRLRGTFDVIVANLFAELHVELFGAYVRRLAPGGHALLTGILEAREVLVSEAIPSGLSVVGTDRDSGWILVHLRRGR